MSSCSISRRFTPQLSKSKEKRIIRVFDLFEESKECAKKEGKAGNRAKKSAERQKRRAARKSAEGVNRKRSRWSRKICFDEGGAERVANENTADGCGAVPETSTSGVVIPESCTDIIFGSALFLGLDDNCTPGYELELEKQKNEVIVVSSIEGFDFSSTGAEILKDTTPLITASVSSSEIVNKGPVTEENVEDLSPCDVASIIENFDLLDEINETPVNTQLPEGEELISDIGSFLENAKFPEEMFDIQSQNDDDGYLALQEAIEQGSLSKADAALRKGKHLLNDKNNFGKTPLHMAVRYMEKEIVRLFIESKADITLKDEQGDTALHLAIRRKENDLKLYGCFKILIESKEIGKIINTFNSQGYSPLHLAAIYGAYEEARCMLKKGAQVNLKDGTSGRTALFHAVEQGNVKLVNLLLNNGADINAKNMSRQTPYMAARIVSTRKASGSKNCLNTVYDKYSYFYAL